MLNRTTNYKRKVVWTAHSAHVSWMRTEREMKLSERVTTKVSCSGNPWILWAEVFLCRIIEDSLEDGACSSFFFIFRSVLWHTDQGIRRWRQLCLAKSRWKSSVCKEKLLTLETVRRERERERDTKWPCCSLPNVKLSLIVRSAVWEVVTLCTSHGCVHEQDVRPETCACGKI